MSSESETDRSQAASTQSQSEASEGGSMEAKLYAPDRRIRAKRTYVRQSKVQVDDDIIRSRLTARFATAVNQQCDDEGLPHLFRQWDEVDVSGLRRPPKKRLTSKLTGALSSILSLLPSVR